MASEQLLNETLTELSAVLSEEKTALLQGRYEELPKLTPRKNALAERLDKMLLDQAYASHFPVYRKRLAAVVKAAQDNERLLASAKNGALMAQSHIKSILNRQRDVGVYTEAGGKLLSSDAGITRQKLA